MFLAVVGYLFVHSLRHTGVEAAPNACIQKQVTVHGAVKYVVISARVYRSNTSIF